VVGVGVREDADVSCEVGCGVTVAMVDCEGVLLACGVEVGASDSDGAGF
jgi:hypothetical protein